MLLYHSSLTDKRDFLCTQMTAFALNVSGSSTPSEGKVVILNTKPLFYSRATEGMVSDLNETRRASRSFEQK